MGFLRTVLGVRVPEVLAWSSRASETAVGAEFVVMEKVSGVQLSLVWETMSEEERAAVVRDLISAEKKLLVPPVWKFVFQTG
jgi:aminoglycoside phosphotransferase (APT) family kinase protein